MKTKKIMAGIFSALVVLFVPIICFAARDLSSAAESAVSQATTIAKAISVLGILCGAVIYQIPGATMFARGTMIGGMIGAGLSFAGPSLISIFKSIFGG